MSSVPGATVLARVRARDDLPDLRQAPPTPEARAAEDRVRPGLLRRVAQEAAARLRAALKYEELDGVRAEAARIAARKP